MNKTVEFFETVFLSEKCEVSKVITMVEVQSFGHDTGPQSFCYLFIALPITRGSKSTQKFAVRVCQSNRQCCYGNHAAGSKPILKLFIISIEYLMRSIATKNN